jgi:integrase
MGDRLTRRWLDAWLKAADKGAWLWCGELKGFGAHHRGNGRASFVVQLRVGRGRPAKRRRVVLGEYPAIAPEEARQRAVEHISAGWRGEDLVEATRATQFALARHRATFAELAPTFHTARRSHLKARSADQYEAIWNRFILPELGSKAISATKRREIASLMDRVEAEAGPSVADRIHDQLALFFRWHAERDDEFVSPLVRVRKRHRKGDGARPMTDDELRQFWGACEKAGLAGVAGRLCLLTATRRTETTAAPWREFAKDGIWTIASNRSKTKRTHLVPLSKMARAVVAALEAVSPFLFSRTACAPDPWTIWGAIVDAGGPNSEGLSWHSLRKTARTLMARSGVRADHAERAIGHIQGAVERAYDKHDYIGEKRAAFEALASEVERIVSRGDAARIAA